MSISDQADIADAKRLFSAERLAPFVRLAGTDSGAIALHLQTMRISAALMPIVGLLEVAIRNAIADRLSAVHGATDWIRAPKSPFEWKEDEDAGIRRAIAYAQRSSYAKLDNREKQALDKAAFPNGVPSELPHGKRVKERQKRISVSTDEIVVQLTIFFWKRLFSSDYEATLWKPALRGLFPNKAIGRAIVSTNLESLYEVRNRIAHHEPIHGGRLREVLKAIDFVIENFERRSPDPNSLLARLTAGMRADLRREVAALEALLAAFRSRIAGT
jgi:hypothetical protein